MKKIISLFLLLLAGCATTQSNVSSPNAPAELAIEVNESQFYGNLLHQSYLKGPFKDSETVVKVEEMNDKIDSSCGLEYNPYVVVANNERIVYLIGETIDKNKIVFGKHYKIVDNSITASTKTCFIFPEPPANAVGAFITHLLSDVPSEFHVFIALKYQIPIYVATSKGNWVVVNDTIDFMGTRK